MFPHHDWNLWKTKNMPGIHLEGVVLVQSPIQSTFTELDTIQTFWAWSFWGQDSLQYWILQLHSTKEEQVIRLLFSIAIPHLPYLLISQETNEYSTGKAAPIWFLPLFHCFISLIWTFWTTNSECITIFAGFDRLSSLLSHNNATFLRFSIGHLCAVYEPARNSICWHRCLCQICFVLSSCLSVPASDKIFLFGSKAPNGSSPKEGLNGRFINNW